MVPEEKPFRVHCTWVLKKNPSQSMHLGAEQILQNPCTWCCCCEEMPSCNWVQKKSFRICAPRCCGEEFFSESRCTWVLFCRNPLKVHEQQVLGSEWIVAIRAHKLELVHEESLRKPVVWYLPEQQCFVDHWHCLGVRGVSCWCWEQVQSSSQPLTCCCNCCCCCCTYSADFLLWRTFLKLVCGLLCSNIPIGCTLLLQERPHHHLMTMAAAYKQLEMQLPSPSFLPSQNLLEDL